MNIAIVGTGNVGGALASRWAKMGHSIYLGVRDASRFKGIDLLKNPNTWLHTIPEAVKKAEVVLLATPAHAAVAVAQSLGDTTGKVVIDAMNIVLGKGPEGFTTTAEAILTHTHTKDVVKCFNTTGYNNLQNPLYGTEAIDLFTCGNSLVGKAAAQQLAKDAGFANCYDIGGDDKFELMEQFALFWINLAMYQGRGREIAFKLLTR